MKISLISTAGHMRKTSSNVDGAEIIGHKALALIATVASLAIVIILTARDRKLVGTSGVVVATAAWLIGTVVLLLRLRSDGMDFDDSLWSIFVLLLWIIVCTLGRPAVLMDGLFARKEASRNVRLRSIVGQTLVIIGIIFVAAITEFT